MIGDIRVVLWKEAREVMRQPTRELLLSVIAVAALGVYVGFSAGDLTSPWTGALAIVAGVTALGVVMAMPIVADAFAGERERHTLETLVATRLSMAAILMGKVGAATLYGWMFSVASLLAALGTMMMREANSPALERLVFTATFVVSPLVISLVGTIGALMSSRSATVKQAQQKMVTVMIGTVFVALVPAFAFMIVAEGGAPPLEGLLTPAARLLRVLLETPGPVLLILVFVVLLVLNGVLLAVGLARFRRERLIVG